MTKARVQQIANAPSKFAAVGYAFYDNDGQWYGERELLPSGSYVDRPMSYPFKPADRFNPLWGQILTVRCGDLPDDHQLGLNVLFVATEDAGMRPVRVTHLVLDGLFGPHEMGTVKRDQWEVAREQRRRELEAE